MRIFSSAQGRGQEYQTSYRNMCVYHLLKQADFVLCGWARWKWPWSGRERVCLCIGCCMCGLRSLKHMGNLWEPSLIMKEGKWRHLAVCLCPKHHPGEEEEKLLDKKVPLEIYCKYYTQKLKKRNGVPRIFSKVETKTENNSHWIRPPKCWPLFYPPLCFLLLLVYVISKFDMIMTIFYAFFCSLHLSPNHIS